MSNREMISYIRNSTKVAPLGVDSSDLPTVEWWYITPEIAELILDLNVDNRRLRQNNVGMIYRDMKNGKYRQDAIEPIRIADSGKLIDGQHRLISAVKAGYSGWFLVGYDLDESVQTVLDTGSRRSAGDAVKFANKDASNTNAVAALARLYIDRDNGGVSRALQRANSSYTNTEIIEWTLGHDGVQQAIEMAYAMRSVVGGSLAAYAYCFMKMTEIDSFQAVDFFQAVMELDFNGANDPRKTLYKYLVQMKDKGRGNPQGSYIFYFARCWNAYRLGQDLQKVPMIEGYTEDNKAIGRVIPDFI